MSAASTTTTLVLTDVAGSTRLWAEHPDLMSAVMGRHHAIVHAAVTADGGWRPVDQGEGDAVFAAFESAAAAVAAVVRFQREMAAEPWPAGIDIAVRVGVHTGEVVARDGNLFGSTVNRCARLRGLGAGGQVLLSAATWELVRDRLPDGVTVTDLGEHRMKDLTRPEHVHQLIIPGLPTEFPPLASLDRAQHNLPIQTSSFLGRDREVAELVDLVTRERLVTITGFGGMGKTRLALQVAAEMATGDGDGVWFVDLSNETDPDRVPSVIATTLGIADGPDGTLPALLTGLKDQNLLLVLDNLEQLLPKAALVVDRLARAGSNVRILTTCREPLRVAGEQEYVLEPLPVPPPPAGGALTEAEIARLSTYAAVSLFLTRAAAARREFTLTPGNAAAVAAICARLDGLPLALELAAARTRSMSPEALLPRLDQALKVLTGGDRSLPTRHQTLRATIAWSYDTLDANEQELLDRLSVFPGSFTLDAAEAICGPPIDDGDDLDVLDGISVLVDRSLLRHHPATDDQPDDRYSLLASIGEFAAHHFDQAGHTEILQSRHASHYTQLAIRPPDYTREQNWLSRRQLRQELHHLVRAVEWQYHYGSAEGELIIEARLLGNLIDDGRNDEAIRLGMRGLDRVGGSTSRRVLVMSGLTTAANNTGRLDLARSWSARGIVEAEPHPDRSVLAYHLSAVLPVEQSRSKARSYLRRALHIVGGLPATGCFIPPWMVRMNLEGNAASHVFIDPEWAEAAIRRQLVADPGESFHQASVGRVLTTLGRLSEAGSALRRFEPTGGQADWPWISRTVGLSTAADWRIAEGDLHQAIADVDGLERLASEAGSAVWAAEAHLKRATIEHLTGQTTAALTRLKSLSEAADLSDELRRYGELGIARLQRDGGDTRAADRPLARAWAGVAGEDARSLDWILECLLEGATQALSTEPVLAACLLGLVQAHRGPFLLSPFYDPDGLLAALCVQLGDSAVDQALRVTATRELPEDPDWDAVLESLRALGDPESRGSL